MKGSFKDKDKETLSAYGKIGGVRSGEARRAKKRMKESLEILLTMPLKGRGQITEIEDIKAFAQLKGKNLTVEQAMLIAQIQKALKGDPKAFELIRDTSGQNPIKEDW